MTNRTAELLENEIVYDVIPESTEHKVKTEAEQLAEALEQDLSSEGEAIIEVYREITGYRNKEVVGHFPADKYTLPELIIYLKTNYGPADYRIILKVNKKIKQNKLISIAAPLSNSTDITPQQTSVDPNAHALGDQLRRLTDLIVAQTQKDPMHEMKNMFAMMTMMREAMGIPATPIQPADPIKQLENSLALLDRLKGINGENEEKEPSMLELADKYAPIFMKALDGQNSVNFQQKPQSKEVVMKQHLQQLVLAASRNDDPGIYAEQIATNLPEELVKNFMMSDNALHQMSLLEKGVLNFESWFNDLKEHIKAIYGMESKFESEYSTFDNEADINGENTAQADQSGERHISTE